MRKYIPILVWLLILGTLLIIPLSIIGYGYLPPDDALRHAAKVISQKPWNEIMVMRPEFSMDHNYGWHLVLELVQRCCGLDIDGIVAFSVVILVVFFFLSGLVANQNPESWIIVLLAAMVAMPGYFSRICLGRPFIFSIAILIILLRLWTQPDADTSVSKKKLIATMLLIAMSEFIHGAWYLFALPISAFFIASRWKAGLQLTLCWIVGSVLGAALTGHPYQYLKQAILIMTTAFGNQVLERFLVSEFQSSYGEFQFLMIIFAVALVRHRQGQTVETFLKDPLLILAFAAWILGLKVQRFWLDWGIPSALLWCAISLQDSFHNHLKVSSIQRIIFTGFCAVGLFFLTTTDKANRWTTPLTNDCLTADNPDLAGWLPEKNGIVYSASMSVFYQMFYKNPRAQWRYLLGFEPTFMPPEDLQIYRNLQLQSKPEAILPWINKMKPEDRLILECSAGTTAALQPLEWHQARTGLWIGRLKRISPKQ